LRELAFNFGFGSLLVQLMKRRLTGVLTRSAAMPEVDTHKSLVPKGLLVEIVDIGSDRVFIVARTDHHRLPQVGITRIVLRDVHCLGLNHGGAD
jgi:hypothetical protein